MEEFIESYSSLQTCKTFPYKHNISIPTNTLVLFRYTDGGNSELELSLRDRERNSLASTGQPYADGKGSRMRYCSFTGSTEMGSGGLDNHAVLNSVHLPNPDFKSSRDKCLFIVK